MSKVIVRYSLFAYAQVRKAKNQIKRRIKETSTILKIIQIKTLNLIYLSFLVPHLIEIDYR